MTTIIISNKSGYELNQIANNERINDSDDLHTLINPNERYHVVDYNGKTLATAKTKQKALEQANRVNGFSPECVIDEKNLIAYNIKHTVYGAGHIIYTILESRY